MPALASLVLTCLAALPQGPEQVLATYQLDGKPATISAVDVALEMATHLRRDQRGQQAVEQLVATVLTRRAATEKNLLPNEADVRTFWRDLQDQLRAAGRRPEEFPAVRNSGEAQWLADLSVQMAQERLVRAELGLGKKDEVSPDMLQLWLQEERKKHEVVVDADALPPGSAARVGSTDVPLIDLGFLLLRTAEDDERDRFLHQVAYLTTLELLARRDGIEVTASDLDAAVEKHRDDASRDPRFRGVTFENMLKAQGLSVAALRDRRVFRAHILLDKIAARRFTPAELAAELAKDRQGVLDLVGPRRRVGLVFVRALAEPNGLITRDFAAALAHLERVHDRLVKETFENVARIESEHASSKMKDGDTGWHRRRSDRLPDAMLATAFALPKGEVSMPLRSEEGVFLVKALEVEPDPDDAVLLQRLAEFRSQDLSKRLLADAKVEIPVKKAVAPR